MRNLLVESKVCPANWEDDGVISAQHFVDDVEGRSWLFGQPLFEYLAGDDVENDVLLGDKLEPGEYSRVVW